MYMYIQSKSVSIFIKICQPVCQIKCLIHSRSASHVGACRSNLACTSWLGRFFMAKNLRTSIPIDTACPIFMCTILHVWMNAWRYVFACVHECLCMRVYACVYTPTNLEFPNSPLAEEERGRTHTQRQAQRRKDDILRVYAMECGSWEKEVMGSGKRSLDKTCILHACLRVCSRVCAHVVRMWGHLCIRPATHEGVYIRKQERACREAWHIQM